MRTSVAFFLLALVIPCAAAAQTRPAPVKGTPPVETSVYDFTMNDIDGKPVSLASYKGETLLIVNTASECGYTPQYEGLEKLYEQYAKRGFKILAFPANNFGAQEPGTNAEIKTFCTLKYHTTFPVFSKISVKGADQHPLYAYLTKESPFPGEVKWNFQKYLVNSAGRVTGRYFSAVEPMSSELRADIEKSLPARHK